MRLLRLRTALAIFPVLLLGVISVAEAQRFPSMRRFPAAPGIPSQRFGEDAFYAPVVQQPQTNSDLVGLQLRNVSRADLHNQPISFGQVFLTGKVPRGSGLTARIANQAVPAQMDAKAFNADGSVRMAVVTVQVPSLSANAGVPVMLSLGPQASGEVPLSGLQSYDVSVDIAVQGGKTYHIDAGQLVAAALGSKSPSYWLRGPLATEIRVDKPVVGSLHVTFDIRAYANGGTLTDVEFKNDYALQAQGGDLNYDVAISSGGSTVFRQQNVLQHQYTHWHKLVGHGGPDEIVVVHDIAQLERANAILDYDLKAGVDSRLITTHLRTMSGDGFGILGNAGVTWYMPTTGERADIGPTTQANTVWLLTQDPDAQAFALAQADAAGTVPWHYYDVSAGTFVTTKRHPKLWADSRASRLWKNPRGLQHLTQDIAPFSVSCQCFELDHAHQPDLSFVPYILTGERYYLDQLQAQGSWEAIGQDPNLRLFDKGIVLYPETQLRAQSWAFRGIINAAWITPDNDPLKNYFEQLQANNLDHLLKQISLLHEGEASGWVPDDQYVKVPGMIAPWQQNYIAYIMTLAAKRGDEKALQIVKWETNFLAGRFLAQSKGLSPFDAAGYRLATYAGMDQIGGAYRTWAQIGQATVAAGFSVGGNDWPKDTSTDYLQASKGALASIFRVTGSPQAREAYNWLAANSSNKAGILQDRRNPVWRVVLPEE